MARPKENLEKHTIRLSQGAGAKLRAYYPNLAHNRIIRVLVDKHLQMLEEASSAARSDLEAIRNAATALIEEATDGDT